MTEILTREQIWEKKKRQFIARGGSSNATSTSYPAPQFAAPNSNNTIKNDLQMNAPHNVDNTFHPTWNAPAGSSSNSNPYGQQNNPASYLEGNTLDPRSNAIRNRQHPQAPALHPAPQQGHYPGSHIPQAVPLRHNQSSIVFGSDQSQDWNNRGGNGVFPNREGMLQPPVAQYPVRAPSPYQSYEAQTSQHPSTYLSRAPASQGPNYSKGYGNDMSVNAPISGMPPRGMMEQRAPQDSGIFPPISVSQNSKPPMQSYPQQQHSQYSQQYQNQSGHSAQYPPATGNSYDVQSAQAANWDTRRPSSNSSYDAPPSRGPQPFPGHSGGYSAQDFKQQSRYATPGAPDMLPHPQSHQQSSAYPHGSRSQSQLYSDPSNFFGSRQDPAPRREMAPTSQVHSNPNNPLSYNAQPTPGVTPNRTRGSVHTRTSLW